MLLWKDAFFLPPSVRSDPVPLQSGFLNYVYPAPHSRMPEELPLYCQGIKTVTPYHRQNRNQLKKTGLKLLQQGIYFLLDDQNPVEYNERPFPCTSRNY